MIYGMNFMVTNYTGLLTSRLGASLGVFKLLALLASNSRQEVIHGFVIENLPTCFACFKPYSVEDFFIFLVDFCLFC